MPHDQAAPIGPRRRWAALGVMALALLTVALDLTVLHVALPTLAVELDATTSELQWFANAYTLVLAAGLLPAGRLGDRHGQRRLFLAALALFGAASLLCGWSTSPTELIAARVVLGVAAAFMIPLSMSLLTVLFPPAERARAVAVWTTTTVLGIPLGPVLGGWLLEHHAWGSVFLINVPLVVVSLVSLPFLLPRTPADPGSRVDAAGVALSSAGLVAATYGLTRAGQHGWDAATIASGAAGAVLLVACTLWLRRARDPLFDLGLFRTRGFAAGSGLVTVASFTMFGAIFVLPQYFQVVSGAEPFDVGLRVLPVVAGLLVGVQAGERVRRRFGATVAVTSGFAALTCGLLTGAATTSASAGSWLVAAWTTLLGAGLGAVIPPTTDAALGALPPGRTGVGSGLVQALRQLGGTLGVALLGAVLNAGYRGSGGTGDSPAAAAATARETGDGGTLAMTQGAFVDGMAALLVACAAVTAAAAVVAWRFLPARAADVVEHDRVAGA